MVPCPMTNQTRTMSCGCDCFVNGNTHQPHRATTYNTELQKHVALLSTAPHQSTSSLNPGMLGMVRRSSTTWQCCEPSPRPTASVTTSRSVFQCRQNRNTWAYRAEDSQPQKMHLWTDAWERLNLRCPRTTAPALILHHDRIAMLTYWVREPPTIPRALRNIWERLF